MTPVFSSPGNWRWNRHRDQIHLGAWLNSSLVICRISREAIEDHCVDTPTPSACLEAAKRRVEDITKRLGDLIDQGRFEMDGSVLLRSADW